MSVSAVSSGVHSEPTSATPPPERQQPPQSLDDMLKSHKLRMSLLKEDAETKYRTSMDSSATASAVLAADANSALTDIFAAEKNIDSKIKELCNQTEQYKKKISQWSGLFVKFSQSVKELGDVHNWSQSIHADVVETLQILDEVSAKKREVLGIASTTAQSE
eukprot:Tbor_TRINITY_DN5351_c2_g1::TRINITY_DN5351_c2_g1_i1::g.3835::m.3835/K20185/BLOC1S1; biogenesis of lysosome-related organelles complex 1 subunit 1